MKLAVNGNQDQFYHGSQSVHQSLDPNSTRGRTVMGKAKLKLTKSIPEQCQPPITTSSGYEISHLSQEEKCDE